MKLSRFTSRFYVALGIVFLVAFFGTLGPLLFTGKDLTTVVGGLYDAPSGKAWLGTDNLGHDVFTYLMYGTRSSLIVGVISGLIATFIGVVVGTVAGYVGGAVEETLMAATNIMLAIPQIVVLVLISVALDSRSVTSVAIVIAVTSWPWTARAVRAQASSVRTREHLDIARLSGANTVSIIVFDVLPYMLSYVVMVFVLQISIAILSEAALSLLGLGPSEGTSLGLMLHWALAWESVRNSAWWAFVPPTIMLTMVAFGFLLLQSSLDEVFNPRLRRDSGRKRRKRIASARTAAEAAEAATTSGSGA
ncbi:MAG: ABC transporter permease [Dactylosporangium sp.]|nr:ABC transporter permease [Dactylosporangium sp.]NNJ60656.1 ABC transporter permease [Dactylosporangium sp.]